eukprot:9468367-Prorocentrum_lima.AAC.1
MGPELPHPFSPEEVAIKRTKLHKAIVLNQQALAVMRTMYENLLEDLNEDEYEAPPPLEPDDPTPPSSP